MDPPGPAPTDRDADGIRFTDILVTATSIARFLGAPVIEPAHFSAAFDLLDGKITPHDLGRPRPSLDPGRSAGPSVDRAITTVVQRWWDTIAKDPMAELTEHQISTLRNEIERTSDSGDERSARS